MTDEEMLHELTKDGDPEGEFCCPLCYTWYKTREEKHACLENHGQTCIEIIPGVRLWR